MPKPNDRVSEYILEAEIGAGAFGQVWRARHHVWADQIVAVKIPHDPQYIRDLQREGAAIQGLTHPNVVRAIGFDPYAQPPYLTMEYVPGTSLRPLIVKRTLRPGDAVDILRQVLTGLAYAHVHGVVHRDLKPENILIHEDAFRLSFAAPGTVRVTDFGLGLGGAGSAAGSIVYSASLNDSKGREIAGSLDYMSPEQRAGAAVDERADLYACGVVLYEMLTGEKPAGTELPSDLNPASPKWLDDVFKRSYARLEKRFTSAGEFLKALGSGAAQPPSLPNGIAAPRGGTRDGSAVMSLVAKRTTNASCPRCRARVDGGDQFCIHCGMQMVTHVRRCPACGAFPDTTDRFCITCGQGLGAELTRA